MAKKPNFMSLPSVGLTADASNRLSERRDGQILARAEDQRMPFLVPKALDPADENDVIATLECRLGPALEIGHAIGQDRTASQTALMNDAVEFLQSRARKMLRQHA